MLTVNELLYDCIRFDEEKLAYSIYYLLKNGIKQGHENAKSIDWTTVNNNEVKRMMIGNELNLKTIKIYAVPLEDRHFAIIFAESIEHVRGHCLNELGLLPEKILEMPQTKIETSFWFPEINQYKSLRQLKDETFSFPCTALIYQKER